MLLNVGVVCKSELGGGDIACLFVHLSETNAFIFDGLKLMDRPQRLQMKSTQDHVVGAADRWRNAEAGFALVG